MKPRFVLTEYIEQAVAQAKIEELGESSFGGTIPTCLGVVALGNTPSECREELRSVLEEWVLVGLRLGHHLPVVGGIDLNSEVTSEPVESL